MEIHDHAHPAIARMLPDLGYMCIMRRFRHPAGGADDVHDLPARGRGVEREVPIS